MPDEKIDPISAVLYATARWDSALAALADVRETFYEATRALWDEGISRYLKLRYDAIIDDAFEGDHAAASSNMDRQLADYDVKETIHRAIAVSDAPLMLEILAYVMALATICPGQLHCWRTFATVIGHLYREASEPSVLSCCQGEHRLDSTCLATPTARK